MIRRLILLTAFFGLIGCRQAPPRVEIETTMGTIVAEIYLEQAPISAGNFLRIVSEGMYDEGAGFYRITRPDNQPNNGVKIDVIQGGLRGRGNAVAAIPHETTEQTGLRHLDGTLSMARAEPGTASSEFFICIGDQPELDYGGRRNADGQGFAVFGRVIKGMDVVRAIQALPAQGQQLEMPVAIISIRQLK